MSVNQKHEEMAREREQFAKKQAEFAVYAAQFSEDVRSKQAEAADLAAEFGDTEEVFDTFAAAFIGTTETTETTETDGDDTGTTTDDDQPAAGTTVKDSLDTGDAKETAAGAETGTGETIKIEGLTADVQSEADSDSNSDPNTETNDTEETVTCRVCGKQYKAITVSHVRTHDMSIEEYRDEFGSDVTLWP